jgi:putative transposase
VPRVERGLGDDYIRRMPRAPRLELPDGFMHVTCRGNRRQRTFLLPGDQDRYLHFLGSAAERFDWRVITYCLMPNHVHLVVDARRADLSAGMHRLSGSYAQWFNNRHELDGHLFQGRFHAEAIETESHLLEAVRYALLNPRRAGLSRRAAEWRWSGYRATVGADPRPPFLAVDWLLEQFSPNRYRARSEFRAFVNTDPRTDDGLVLPSRVPGTVPGTALDQPWPYAPGNRSVRSRISSAAGRPTTFR